MLLLIICRLEAKEIMNEMEGLVVDDNSHITTCINTYKKNIYIFTSLKSLSVNKDILDREKKVFSMGKKDE